MEKIETDFRTQIYFRMSFRTSFSSNKNYTIRSTRTLNSCSTSIFHDLQRLDILRIHITQRLAYSIRLNSFLILRARIIRRMFLIPPLVDPVHPPDNIAKIRSIHVKDGHKL